VPPVSSFDPFSSSAPAVWHRNGRQTVRQAGNLFHQLGSFFGGWLGGWLYDRTGSYDLVWQIAIALSLIAAVLNWPIREQPVDRLRAAQAN